MDSSTKHSGQKILSLCTGFRGIEKGIELSGTRINPVAYVEIEAFQVFNLVKAMEAGVVDAAPVWTDLKTFPSEGFRNKIHGITGGYPCQPFSAAGARKGTDDPRHLWPHIEKIIESTRPVWCFFENVEGHLSMGFKEVYRSLRNLGYTVEAGLYSAEEVGAPHQRKRLFILAVDDAHIYDDGNYTRKIQRETKEIKTEKQREERQHLFRERGRAELIATSKKLGDAESDNERHEVMPTETWRKSIGGSGEVADAISIRQQKLRLNRKQNKEGYGRIGSSRWPSSMGEPQYEWEEPRAVEPGLGCTIDGYNFRTDLLRGLGNSVVPQTAAKAWIELWKKFN